MDSRLLLKTLKTYIIACIILVLGLGSVYALYMRMPQKMHFLQRVRSLKNSTQIDVHFQDPSTKQWQPIRTIRDQQEIRDIVDALVGRGWRRVSYGHSACGFYANLIFSSGEGEATTVSLGTDGCGQYFLDGGPMQGTLSFIKESSIRGIIEEYRAFAEGKN